MPQRSPEWSPHRRWLIPIPSSHPPSGLLKGPLHGRANEEVVQMLKEIGEPKKARSYLEEQIRARQKLMGFGHRVYKVKDPRATILQGLCERLFKESGTSPLYEVALEVEWIAEELLKGKGYIPTSTSTRDRLRQDGHRD